MNWIILWAKIRELEESSGGSSGGGNGLSVVELSTVLPSSMGALSADDSAKLTEMQTNGLPFIVKCSTETMGYCAVMQAVVVGGSIAAFSGQVADSFITFAPNGDSWMGQIVSG